MKQMTVNEMIELVNKSDAAQLKKIPEMFVEILPKQVRELIKEKTAE